MDNVIHTWLQVLTVVGIIAAIVAIGFAVWRLGQAIARAASGWKNIVQRFPDNGDRMPGVQYPCKGKVSGLECGYNAFRIQIAYEGLRITPTFARNAPVLVPWPAVKQITETDLGILGHFIILQVDYEKRMQFTVPVAMLNEMRQYLPADHFQKLQSLGEVIARGIQQRRQK